MRFVEKVKSLQGEIEVLLRNSDRLKDNDNAIIANIWSKEIDLNELTAFEFLKIFSQGKLSSVESIVRARRKLQEENIAFRGRKYQMRKQEEQYTRDNINK